MIGRYAGILFFIFAELAAIAVPPPSLQATVNELAPRTRRNAPEWVEVTMRSRSTGLREGALEFTMFEWGEPIYRYRTHELVINSGDQRFRFMLPAANAIAENSDRKLTLRFLEDDTGIPLGEFPLVAVQKSGRTNVIAVIRPQYRATGVEAHPVWHALRLEHYAPEQGPQFDTTPIFFDPKDVPADALGYFPFDMVLIESDAFGQIREKARTAIGQWVNAGGALCIMAERAIDPELVTMINQLGVADPKWTLLIADETGRLVLPDRVAIARANFGRLAIAGTLPPEDTQQKSPEWSRAAGFLWGLRAEQAEHLAKHGKWIPVQRDYQLTVGPRGPIRPQSRFYESDWSRASAPVESLLPEKVRLIPLWVLISLIGLFVLLAGPGDWFILGAMRRHRYTWLLFPATAVLITAGTVLLSKQFMGQADYQTHVVISDIGTNGRVVRETRLELDLPASQRITATETRNELRVPLDGSDELRWGRGQRSGWEEITYAGQYPARFEYIRPQRQWSPRLSRATRVLDEPDTSGVKWDAFDEFRAPTILENEAINRAASRAGHEGAAYSVFSKWGSRSAGKGPTEAHWRDRLTLTNYPTVKPLFAQISPNGSSRLDDLKIVEPWDPTRMVVVAAVQEGKNIRVWRRLILH